MFILKLRTNLVLLLFVFGPLFYGDEYLSVCICTIYIQRGQKRVLTLLELKLQMFVSCHVDAGNRTQVLSKGSSYSLTRLASQDPWSSDLLL